jgi:hypothetical protein
MPQTLTVHVEPPEVRRGKVTFRWSQDGQNALQTRNRWFVDYHGVPVGRMDRRLLYDVLLSLQLPVWNAMADRVEVHLPEPVGRVSLEFWHAYHRSSRVGFAGAVDDTRRYDPGRAGVTRRAGRPARDRQVAVTFGGGKDSTLAQQALLERRTPRDVLLLHVVQLFAGHPVVRRRTTARSLRTIVGPNWLRFRTPVQLVTTDYMAVLRSGSGAPRPHVNLYVGAMLPALVHHGLHQVVFSRTALGYRVHTGPDGRPTFTNPSGRPERLAYLRAYYADVLGWDLHAESTHRAVGEYVSYGTVLGEYPRAFRSMVMCTRTLARERFCHDCPKCLEFALLGLAHDHVAPDLDYDRLLTGSTVTQLAAVAEEVVGERAWHGAAPYRPEIGTASHFATWCHALHQVDPDRADLGVGEPARAHLRALKGAWGTPFPAVASVDAAAVEACGPLGREVAAAAARRYPVVPRGSATEPEHLLLVGDEPARFDHAAAMPTPRLRAWADAWGVPGVDGAATGVR